MCEYVSMTRLFPWTVMWCLKYRHGPRPVSAQGSKPVALWTPGCGSLTPSMSQCHWRRAYLRGDPRELCPLTASLDPKAVFALLVGWCRSPSKGEQAHLESEPLWEPLAVLGETESRWAGSGLWPESLDLRSSPPAAEAAVQEAPSENHWFIPGVAGSFHWGSESKHFWLLLHKVFCKHFGFWLLTLPLPSSYVYNLTVSSFSVFNIEFNSFSIFS